MLSTLNIEVVGFVAGLLGLVAWLPQINEVWRYKRHEGVSWPTLFTILTTLAMWVIYGILINSISIIISNMAAMTLIGIVSVGVLRLRLMSSKERLSAEFQEHEIYNHVKG